MKLVSAILAMLILFLTIQPVLSSSGFVAEQSKQDADNCCANKKHLAPKHKSKQESNNGCCSNGHCSNPFLSCSDCFFITRIHSYLLTTGAPVRNQKNELAIEKPLLVFIKEFWHPPETIFQTLELKFKT